ncbi:hypothetical protein [Neorhodopirellula pilleata]|uniref:Uncharacterized protein n=1 Tax=Neorhodopirellula pilleata TaxID=2714738 RepID=A0A5C6ARH7_9BACT|nr:hypothetical protein [Neorhodopirellula pilleata]TWU02107.1 hypothetical protein Pla100_18470 [Neorhodopirellula pilleata]
MDTTPQIEAILDKLADHCCAVINQDETYDATQVNKLVTSLSVNGWRRHSDTASPLSVTLKNRMKDRCREPSIHRGGLLDGMVEKVQAAYDDVARYDSSSPETQNEPHSISPQTMIRESPR